MLATSRAALMIGPTMFLNRRRFLATALAAPALISADRVAAQGRRRAFPADTTLAHPIVTPQQRAAFDEAAAVMRAASGEQLLVMHRGTVLYEATAGGASIGDPHALASGTKSFSGALAVAAATDGLLQLDEPLSETLFEWRARPRLAAITLRQLLTLTSGIDPGSTGDQPDYAASVREAGVQSAPDETFLYGPVPFQIFGEFLKRKLARQTGESVSHYLSRRILQPIDLSAAAWNGWPSGEPRLASGAFLAAREWAKFGALIALEGRWNGQTIFDADLLRECFKGTAVNPAYGLTWWLNQPYPPALANDAPVIANNFNSGQAAPNAPRGMVIAAGAGKQRLYVIAAQQLVVVRFGKNDPRFDDEALLMPILAAVS